MGYKLPLYLSERCHVSLLNDGFISPSQFSYFIPALYPFLIVSLCIAPQALNDCITSCKVLLYSVNSYSTTTGVPVKTVRLINPFISNSFSSVDNTFAEMPSTFLCSSLNRLLPSERAMIILSFHFCRWPKGQSLQHLMQWVYG